MCVSGPNKTSGFARSRKRDMEKGDFPERGIPLIERACQQCGKIVRAKLSEAARGRGKYCSKECYGLAKRRGQMEVCRHCGQAIYRPRAQRQRNQQGHYFCNDACRLAWLRTELVGPKHPNWRDGRNVYRQRLLTSKTQPKCERCQIADVRVLAVHHRDGDRSHNEPANLVWLCYNCHHLVHYHKVALDDTVGWEIG
jgi:hypothetical protein